MPRAKKDYLCLNVKIDAEICHKLTEVSTEAGQTKTMVVERALQAYFADYDAKQRILRQAEAGQLVPVGEVSSYEKSRGVANKISFSSAGENG